MQSHGQDYCLSQLYHNTIALICQSKINYEIVKIKLLIEFVINIWYNIITRH